MRLRKPVSDGSGYRSTARGPKQSGLTSAIHCVRKWHNATQPWPQSEGNIHRREGHSITPRAIKAFLHRVYQVSDNLISCGICQCPGPWRLKTALLKIQTKKIKSFLQTLESFLLSEAATLSELWLADGLITPPPLLPATVNQREAAEPGEGGKKKQGKKKRHTEPEGKWHTETHNTHKSKYKPCFGSIRGPAGDTLGWIQSKVCFSIPGH